MEYLQYLTYYQKLKQYLGFKPYYKWNTFNTVSRKVGNDLRDAGFKPYYKWNTFNT